jgi:hypothetical protein
MVLLRRCRCWLSPTDGCVLSCCLVIVNQKRKPMAWYREILSFPSFFIFLLSCVSSNKKYHTQKQQRLKRIRTQREHIQTKIKHGLATALPVGHLRPNAPSQSAWIHAKGHKLHEPLGGRDRRPDTRGTLDIGIPALSSVPLEHLLLSSQPMDTRVTFLQVTQRPRAA